MDVFFSTGASVDVLFTLSLMTSLFVVVSALMSGFWFCVEVEVVEEEFFVSQRDLSLGGGFLFSTVA